MKRIMFFAAPAVLATVFLLGCSEDSTLTHAGPGSRQAVVDGQAYTAYASDTTPARAFTGTLAYEDPEWYLDTENETILLHLGNRTYLDAIGDDLRVGARASADGIMDDDGLEVSKLTIGENTVVIRDVDGRPAWPASRGWTTDAGDYEQNDDSTDDSFVPRGGGRGRSGGGQGRAVESADTETYGRNSISYEDERYSL